jgi:hypothetical protein
MVVAGTAWWAIAPTRPDRACDTRYDSQYNTLQPPRLVPPPTRLSMVVMLPEGPCSNISSDFIVIL